MSERTATWRRYLVRCACVRIPIFTRKRTIRGNWNPSPMPKMNLQTKLMYSSALQSCHENPRSSEYLTEARSATGSRTKYVDRTPAKKRKPDQRSQLKITLRSFRLSAGRMKPPMKNIQNGDETASAA